MSKRFGALDIKFQKIKHKLDLLKTLDKRELNRLILEGLITLLALSLSYFGILFLLNKMIYPGPDDFFADWRLYQRLALNSTIIEVARNLFTILMVIFSIWFTRWRLTRRFHNFELRHLLNELDYIASGNYEHRISDESVGRLGSVASSINKLVDSTLHAMAEERRIEQTKNELITNVSHDIRTPLTSVIGYLNLIEDKQYDSQEELLEYVHIAYMKAQQMKGLADNLFDYVKMQDDQEQLHYQSVSAQNFLSQLAAEYENEAQTKGMTIDVDVSPIGMRISMDVEKMVRVYQNIILNAFKYSDASLLTLVARQSSSYTLLQIKNNGLPIDKAAQKKLFLRFYRGDQSRSSAVSGTGLGLAIAEKIVSLHQGRIDVSSNEKETIFTIRLPKEVGYHD